MSILLYLLYKNKSELRGPVIFEGGGVIILCNKIITIRFQVLFLNNIFSMLYPTRI